MPPRARTAEARRARGRAASAAEPSGAPNSARRACAATGRRDRRARRRSERDGTANGRMSRANKKLYVPSRANSYHGMWSIKCWRTHFDLRASAACGVARTRTWRPGAAPGPVVGPAVARVAHPRDSLKRNKADKTPRMEPKVHTS